MTIGELVFELGFKADTVKINDFIGMVGKLNLSSVLASFGVKELYDGLNKIMGIADETAIYDQPIPVSLYFPETRVQEKVFTALAPTDTLE